MLKKLLSKIIDYNNNLTLRVRLVALTGRPGADHGRLGADSPDRPGPDSG